MSLENTTKKIGKKEYVIPTHEDESYIIFEEAFPQCEYYTTICSAKIGIVFIYPYISKTTIAQVRRCNPQLSLFSGYDYIIELSGEIWDKLDEDVRKIVMLHECEHMTGKEDKNGNVKYSLRDHNVKDFMSIIDKYGLNWYKEIQEHAFKMYGKDDQEIDEFNLSL